MAILLETALPTVLATLVIFSVAIPLIIIVNLLLRLTSDASLPPSLPWAGVDENGGRLARLKANLTSFFHLKILMDEGYTKASNISAHPSYKGG
jgi:hypothetical protein